MKPQSHVFIAGTIGVLLLAGCATESASWSQVRLQDTVAAYERHLAQFPSSPHAAEARSRIEILTTQAREARERFASERESARRDLDQIKNEIDKIVRSAMDAWSGNNLKKFQSFFSSDGTTIGFGAEILERVSIFGSDAEQRFAASQLGLLEPLTYEINQDQIQLSPDNATVPVFVKTKYILPDGGALTQDVVRTFILRRRGNSWAIQSLE